MANEQIEKMEKSYYHWMNKNLNKDQMENSYWKGFPTEEDIEIAVEKAVSIMGPQGNIMGSFFSSKVVVPNVVLETDYHGKLWYGDIHSNLEDVQRLATALGIPVKVSQGPNGYEPKVYPQLAA